MSRERWGKLIKGAIVALLGALVAYLPEAVSSFDWGQWTLVAGAVGAILVNFLRHIIAGLSDPPTTPST